MLTRCGLVSCARAAPRSCAPRRVVVAACGRLAQRGRHLDTCTTSLRLAAGAEGCARRSGLPAPDLAGDLAAAAARGDPGRCNSGLIRCRLVSSSKPAASSPSSICLSASALPPIVACRAPQHARTRIGQQDEPGAAAMLLAAFGGLQPVSGRLGRVAGEQDIRGMTGT